MAAARTPKAEPALASVPVVLLGGTPRDARELGCLAAVPDPGDRPELVDAVGKALALRRPGP